MKQNSLNLLAGAVVLRLLPINLISILLAILITAVAEAQHDDDNEQRWENLGRIYRGQPNETVQEFWLLGRYHGQQYWADGDLQDSSDYETRRFRYGFQTRLFEKLTIHAQAVSGSDFEPIYNGFTELWTQWAFTPAVMLTVGQQKNRFTHDRNVSSRYLNYLERGLLTNMFAVDYTPAVTLQGRFNAISYYTGIFSNRTGQNIGESFSELDSGYSLLSAIYLDLGGSADVQSFFLHASYLHSDANSNATNMNRFQDGASVAAILTNRAFSLVTELIWGRSDHDGSSVGLNLQPGIFLLNDLQLVGRYQIATSNSRDGLRPQLRYERELGLENGDLYNAAYVGLNYYISDHRLKVMGGFEYANMDGDQALTSSLMLRFYFGPHSGGAFPMNQMLLGYFSEPD